METNSQSQNTYNMSGNFIDTGTIPNDLELERSVIAAVLTDRDSLNIASRHHLSDRDFFNPDLALIFRTIQQSNDGGPLDVIRLISLLRAEKNDRAAEIVKELMSSFTSTYYVERHVLVLRELAFRRKFRQLSIDSAAKVSDMTQDFDEVIEGHRKAVNMIIEATVNRECVAASDAIRTAIEQIEKVKFACGPSGILSGISPLDEITLGFQPSDLVIVAARPSVGKTAFALNMAVNALKAGHKVGFFSLEMANTMLAMRLISHESGIPSHLLRNGDDLPETDWESIHGVAKDEIFANLYLDETGGITTNDFFGQARRMVTQHQVAIIFVDYLQLMRASSISKNANREQEVAAIAHALKAAAKNLNIPVVALSQLNRNVERTNAGLGPQLSDLRESGAIEQDADVVMLLSNNIYMGLGDTANDINKSREIKVNVAKNRNGRIGEVKLLLYPERMTFAAEPAEEIAAPVTYHTFNNIESF